MQSGVPVSQFPRFYLISVDGREKVPRGQSPKKRGTGKESFLLFPPCEKKTSRRRKNAIKSEDEKVRKGLLLFFLSLLLLRKNRCHKFRLAGRKEERDGKVEYDRAVERGKGEEVKKG